MSIKESVTSPIKETKTIKIEGTEYKYSINQIEKEDRISIKLFEAKPEKNITFIYKATTEQLIKDIKVLYVCENIEEMINSLKDIFFRGKLVVEKKEEKYFMKIEIETIGKLSIYKIQLEKHEPIDEKTEILLKIKEMESKFQEIKEEIDNLKIKNERTNMLINEDEKNKLIREIKENLNLNEKIKEVLKDKNIKEILFKEFEEKMSNIYIKKEKEEKKLEKENIQFISEKFEESVNKIINEKFNNKIDEKVFNENMVKIKENIENQVKEINQMKNKIENNDYIKKEIEEFANKKINENIKENKMIKMMKEQINILNEKNKDNFINLKIEIGGEDIGKDIPIINQCSTYKLFQNFELDDIEIILNGEKIPIKYKHENYDSRICKYNIKSKDSESARKLYSEVNNYYVFYWNFSNEGTFTIKIKFNKKLSSCSGMFYYCSNIIEIDLSEFDCTNVLSCDCMFAKCHRLQKINLGKLNFSLVTTFLSMFFLCYNLDNLDVSHLNTKNSKSFRKMFFGCENLKMIDVSKFDSSKCEDMSYMLYDCKNIFLK